MVKSILIVTLLLGSLCNPVQAFDANSRWKTCQYDTDCVILSDECYSPVAVNKQHRIPFTQQVNQRRPYTSCAIAEPWPNTLYGQCQKYKCHININPNERPEDEPTVEPVALPE